MKIVLEIEKSLEENASKYFADAKKQKIKIERAEEALAKTKKQLAKIEAMQITETTSVQKRKKKEWYEKFRWFHASNGMLVIGGRDATTNELIIKKHTDKEDLVFHTDMAGSPFFVIKSDGKEIPKEVIEEAGDATAVFSRAWKAGHTSASVFYVNPDQVTKEAQAGEYLQKGSFMIRGKTNYLKPKMDIVIGIKDGIIISGPQDAIKPQINEYITIVQGEQKPGAIAKLIHKKIGGDLDEIIRMLPSSNLGIKK